MFVVVFLSCGLSGLVEFIAARHATNFSRIGLGIGITLVILWVISLICDQEFFGRFMDGWRGKLVFAMFPLLCLVFGWISADTLPIVMHTFSKQQSSQVVFEYEKARGRKYCRYRVSLLANQTFENGELCVSESTLQRLPEEGRVKVFGSASEYGLMIDRYRFLSR